MCMRKPTVTKKQWNPRNFGVKLNKFISSRPLFFIPSNNFVSATVCSILLAEVLAAVT